MSHTVFVLIKLIASYRPSFDIQPTVNGLEHLNACRKFRRFGLTPPHWIEVVNLTRGLLIATIGIFATTALAGALGARVNTTGSYPPGLYWMTGEAAHKGT